MDIKLKNYTSGIPIERIIIRIEKLLVSAGATNIIKDYGKDGELTATTFTIQQEGQNVPVRLPARVEEVYNVLWGEVKRPRDDTEKRIVAQASRTAWKLVQDWVEVQISMIRMKQAEFLQVFLPYIWDGKQTFYARLKEQKFKALPEGTKKGARK